MNKEVKSMIEASNGSVTDPNGWASLPAMSSNVGEQALAFPPAPIADAGLIRLGGQAPLFAAPDVTAANKIALGGQSPMFLPHWIADAGLVRLGGQAPII